MKPSTPYVFVSYSSEDGAFAESLVTALEAAQIPFFQDRKRINLGDNFKATISRGLQQATDLVLIASPASMESPWVFFEVGQAIALRCRIVPLLLHPSQRLPSFLSDFQ